MRTFLLILDALPAIFLKILACVFMVCLMAVLVREAAKAWGL